MSSAPAITNTTMSDERQPVPASYRILYLGNDWYGSCARACGFALRRLGHEVIDVSCDRFFPTGMNFWTKVATRIARVPLRNEFNQTVLSAAQKFKPDMLVTFKGCLLTPETLATLRGMGIPLYQYYPDNSTFAQPMIDPATMSEYDCCFYTKKFWLADTERRVKLRNAVYLPHGYDPDVHNIPSITENDRKVYGADIAVIGNYTPGKEAFLDSVLRLHPELPMRIWGDGWLSRCTSQLVRGHLEGLPLYGQCYPKAIFTTKINLALLIEETKGASQPDLTTTRSFEIPACGGFMLHKRTPDILELYREGEEIECYDSPEEVIEKCQFYLKNEERRQEIAQNGHHRAVPAYAYDERMKEILQYHDAHPLR